jgi:type VI secretion system protein ImpH
MSGAVHSPSVQALLQAAAGSFDFVQAVDLIERLAALHHAGALAPAPLGRGTDPRREALSLTAAFAFGFRPAPLARLEPGAAPDPDDPHGAPGRWQMRVNFFGLASADGPLPDAYTELLRTQLLERDSAAADFLGIFQHRLLSLLYRAADALRAAAPFQAPGAAPLAPALRALTGLGASAPARALAQALLPNLPAAVQQRHSMHGFLALLRSRFGVPATGSEGGRRWLELDPELQTVLGERNDLLDPGAVAGAVLGERVLDAGGLVRVDFGAVPAALFRALLPGGSRHAELAALCAWYLGPHLRCELTLAPEPEATRDTLGIAFGGEAFLLGYSSWVGERPHREERGITLILDPLPTLQPGSATGDRIGEPR